MELIILVIWGLIGAFLPIPLGKSRPKLIRSVRFLACYLTLFLGGTSVIFGLSTKDITIFVVCFLTSLWGGLLMLLLPKISPKISKRFNLRW
jgi:hypothetical protein